MVARLFALGAWRAVAAIALLVLRALLVCSAFALLASLFWLIWSLTTFAALLLRTVLLLGFAALLTFTWISSAFSLLLWLLLWLWWPVLLLGLTTLLLLFALLLWLWRATFTRMLLLLLRFALLWLTLLALLLLRLSPTLCLLLRALPVALRTLTLLLLAAFALRALTLALLLLAFAALYFLLGFLTTLATFAFALFLLAFLQVLEGDLAHVVHEAHVGFYAGLGVAGLDLYRMQLVGLLTCLVELLYFLYPGNRKRVLLVIVGIAVPHETLEDIALLQVGYAFNCFEVLSAIREDGEGIHISIQLVIKAALKPATLAGELGLVDGEVLVARCRRVHRLEIGKPCSAAELAAAGAYAPYLTTFLAGTYLLHLDLHLEVAGIELDELAEVDPLIGGIEESTFLTVGLDLHFAKLHLQVQVTRYSAAADQHFRLAVFLLLVLSQLLIGSGVQYALVDRMLGHTIFFQLELYQLTCKVHLANVDTAHPFQGNPVALFNDIVSIVAEELLTTAVIERDLNHGVRFGAI